MGSLGYSGQQVSRSAEVKQKTQDNWSLKSQEGTKLLSQLQDKQAADVPLYSENSQPFGAIQAGN